jgi:prepilin-type processing-associated H-X9-DG protein
MLTSLGRPDDYALAWKRPPMHISYIYCGAGFTSRGPANAVLAYEPLSNHDGDGTNVLYGDGHVSFLDRKETDYLIAELQAGHNPPRDPPASSPAGG